MICFKRKFDTVTKFFSDNKTLIVHELYVYDLMKFYLRSLNKKYPTCFLNSLFTFKIFAYNTRISEGRIFVPPLCKNKVKSCSLTNRGSKLLNVKSINKLLIENIGLMSKNEEYSFVHKYKDNFMWKLRVGAKHISLNFLFLKNSTRWLIAIKQSF